MSETLKERLELAAWSGELGETLKAMWIETNLVLRDEHEVAIARAREEERERWAKAADTYHSPDYDHPGLSDDESSAYEMGWTDAMTGFAAAIRRSGDE